MFKVSAARDQLKKRHIFLWLLIAAQSVLFLMLGLWRHWGYLTSINDLGCFDQVVWSAANDISLVNTSTFSQPIHWLGFHFQPILYLFVPFYKILPSVNWLIATQSIALPFAAWPIFRIAEHITKSEIAAFMWAVAYLCNPLLLNAAAWDFHPVSIAVPFLALSLLAIERDQPVLLCASTVVILSCKEHFGLAVIGLGLWYGIRNKDWVVASAISIAGIVSFVIIIGIIMPSFSFTGQQVMFSDGMGHMSRYNWLGNSLEAIVKKLVEEPLLVLRTIFYEMGGLEYLLLLFSPFLFFSFAAPYCLLPAMADLLANFLSSNPMPRSVFSYHSVPIIPVVVTAAIYGSQKIAHLLRLFCSFKQSQIVLFFSGLVLMINLYAGYRLAPLPLPGACDFWEPKYHVISHDNMEIIVKKIVNDGSLSIQANLGAHFAQRPLLYQYPEKVGEVEFVVLRLDSPTKWYVPFEKGPIGSLAHHLQMDVDKYLDSVTELLRDKQYKVVFWSAPWLVLRQGQPSQEKAESVLLKIEQLRNFWLSKEEEQG